MVADWKRIRSKKAALALSEPYFRGDLHNVTARFFIYSDKRGVIGGTSGCHAGLGMGTSNGKLELVVSKIQHKYTSSATLNYKNLDKGDLTLYLDYLFNHSNFKEAWLIKDIPWVIKTGLLVNDTRAVGWKVGAACVMGRHIHEKPYKVEMYAALVKAGMKDLHMAFLLAHRLKFSEGKIIAYKASTSHATIPSDFTEGFLKNYLKGTPNRGVRTLPSNAPYQDRGAYGGFSNAYSKGVKEVITPLLADLSKELKGSTQSFNPFIKSKAASTGKVIKFSIDSLPKLVVKLNEFTEGLLK